MQEYLNFYKSAWLDDIRYDWYVYMTGNSYSLNEMSYNDYLLGINSPDELYRVNQIREKSITEDELLCLSSSIAKHYSISHKFPKILIVDFLVVRGSRIKSFLMTLELTICQEYSNIFGKLDQTIKRKLHEDLRMAIEVRTYAKSYMLPQSCSFIKAKYTVHIAKWREMLCNISGTVNKGNNICLCQSQYQELRNSLVASESDWQSAIWFYSGVQTEIWQRPVIRDKDGNIKLLLAIQARVSGDKVTVVPIVLFDKVSHKGLIGVFELIGNTIGLDSQGIGHEILSVINRNRQCYFTVKVKQLMYLIGLLELYGYIQAKSFNMPENLMISKIYQVKDQIYDMLSNSLSVMFNCNESADDISSYGLIAEDFLYSNGICHEQDLLNEALYYRVSGTSKKLERPQLSEYIKYCKSMNKISCIGALLAIINSGIAYTYISNSIKDNSLYAVMSVTAGNQALSAIPCRRYYKILPALLKIEKRCLHGGYQVGPNIIGFCKFIGQGDMAVKLCDFYHQVHQFGFRLQDWDFDYSRLLDISVLKTDNQSALEVGNMGLQRERREQLGYISKAYEYKLV